MYSKLMLIDKKIPRNIIQEIRKILVIRRIDMNYHRDFIKADPDISRRKQQGCLTVEMKCSAAFAVTRFKEIPFAQFLYGADRPDSGHWEIRDLIGYGLAGSENYMAFAFECAANL